MDEHLSLDQDRDQGLDLSMDPDMDLDMHPSGSRSEPISGSGPGCDEHRGDLAEARALICRGISQDQRLWEVRFKKLLQIIGCVCVA